MCLCVWSVYAENPCIITHHERPAAAAHYRTYYETSSKYARFMINGYQMPAMAPNMHMIENTCGLNIPHVELLWKANISEREINYQTKNMSPVRASCVVRLWCVYWKFVVCVFTYNDN